MTKSLMQLAWWLSPNEMIWGIIKAKKKPCILIRHGHFRWIVHYIDAYYPFREIKGDIGIIAKGVEIRVLSTISKNKLNNGLLESWGNQS